MGSSLLFSLMITFVIIMLGVFVSSLAYSKAYKVKNKIIDILEENGTNDVNETVTNEINTVLAELGYNENRDRDCEITVPGSELIPTEGFDYCIEKITTSGNKSGNFYYKVTTYMHFDIPIIGEFIAPPVTGESKIIYDTYYNTVDDIPE